MKSNTESVTREDLMGMTIAVLMFVLQGCMVLAMSTDHLVGQELATASATVIAARADASGSGNLV